MRWLASLDLPSSDQSFNLVPAAQSLSGLRNTGCTALGSFDSQSSANCRNNTNKHTFHLVPVTQSFTGSSNTSFKSWLICSTGLNHKYKTIPMSIHNHGLVLTLQSSSFLQGVFSFYVNIFPIRSSSLTSSFSFISVQPVHFSSLLQIAGAN